MPGRVRRRRARRRRHNQSGLDETKQIQAEVDERNLFVYQESCSRGPAIVRLSELSSGSHSNRLIDGRQNVTRLKEILRIQGCLRLSRAFHVPVIIDEEKWEHGNMRFENSTIGPDISLPQLRMGPGNVLLALDHNSLLNAARERFREIGEEDSWWIVDVYVTRNGKSISHHHCGNFKKIVQSSLELKQAIDHQESLRENLTRILRESYRKEVFPSDGRIYQELRFYQSSGNKNAEDFWWAVLKSEPGSRKADHLRNLPESLSQGFDALLPVKGLWSGMRIGVLHKVRAMRCDEVTRFHAEICSKLLSTWH